MNKTFGVHIFVRLFTNLIFVFLCQVSLAEQYKFDEAEVPSERINCIYQDQEGYIWIGSDDGLIKYQGESSVVYNEIPGNPRSLSSNSVKCIIEDENDNLWIGTTNGLNKFNRKTGIFTSYYHDSLTNSLWNNRITCLYTSKNGVLWIGTPVGLNALSVDNNGEERFERIHPENLTKTDDDRFRVSCIFESYNGDVWLGTKDYGLCLLNPYSYALVSYPVPEPITQSIYEPMQAIEEIEQGVLMYGRAHGEVLFFDIQKKEFIQKKGFIKFLEKNDIRNLSLHNAKIDQAGNLWLCADFGLFIIDPVRLKLLYSTDTYRHKKNVSKIHKDQAKTILEDRQGIVLVGFGTNGVAKYNPQANIFSPYFVKIKDIKSRRNYIIEAIKVDGSFWLASFTNGLIQSDAKGNIIQRIYLSDITGSKYSDFIHDITLDADSNLWLGTQYGLFRIDVTRKKNITAFTPEQNNQLKLSSYAVLRLCNDIDKNIWVMTRGVAHILNPMENELIKNETLKDINIEKGPIELIFCDIDEKYLFKCENKLVFYNVNTGKKNYYYANNSPNSLLSNSINCFAKDGKGKYLIGTSIGFSVLDQEQNLITNFGEKDGLASNMILDISSDNSNGTWLVTINGLTKYISNNGSFINYGQSEGVTEKVRRISKTKDGKFIVSGEGGFYYFHPDSINARHINAPIYFTNLSISGRKVASDEAPLNGENIQYKKRIELDYNQRQLTLNFCLLDYSSPKNNQYAYKLEGVDTNWTFLGNRNEINLQNLEPGKYTVCVKGKRKDAAWSKNVARVELLVKPPFWYSKWGIVLYSLFAFVFLIVSRYIAVMGERKRKKQEIDQIKNEKKSEIDSMKLNFFFNLSHEIRTPLMLITGPLAQMLKKVQHSEVQDNLKLIKRNVERMENIINQLLNIRKLDLGKYKPVIIRDDINNYLLKVFDSFKLYCDSSKIVFEVNQHILKPQCWFSPDSIEKIISNLLVNLLKFTPKGGTIYVNCSDLVPEQAKSRFEELKKTMTTVLKTGPIQKCSYLSIRVTDTGRGIEKPELVKIFDDFYRNDPSVNTETVGLDIGLSLTKNMTELLNGAIFVLSEPDKGSIFELLIPIDKIAFKNSQLKEELLLEDFNTFNAINFQRLNHESTIPHAKKVSTPISEKNAAKQTPVLIVDKDPDMLEYVHNILKGAYHAKTCSNTDEAFEIAVDKQVELIIVDVNLPGETGYVLCEKVKNDIRTSHIPVILVSAYASEEFEIKGFESGADDYILKPFKPDLLLLRVASLLDKRKSIWGKIEKDNKLIPENLKLTRYDDYLLAKIIEIIEKNIADPDFNQETIHKELGLSRVQLYRKMKALTNQSIVEFIRNIKLKKAASILRKGKNVNVSELAFSLGYNKPSYFIKLFREEFGETPKVYNHRYCP